MKRMMIIRLLARLLSPALVDEIRARQRLAAKSPVRGGTRLPALYPGESVAPFSRPGGE